MYKMVFSATGRTMKVADAFCSAWENVADVDLSRADFHRPQLTGDDLCLIAVPVYGGCVPAPAAENIRKIAANGASAVIMVVYGNRAYDGALARLKELCAGAGFAVVAAVSAVAQHSMIPQVAADRPDADDKTQLAEWASQILEKFKAGELTSQVSVPGEASFDCPAMPVHPKADGSCTGCGLCAAKCPVRAIPADNPGYTDNTRCITCMRCVEICPSHSRKLMPGLMKAAGLIMKKVWGKHTSNELFI